MPVVATVVCLGIVPAASAGVNWAAPQIRAVTAARVLGSSPATFRAQAPLTQRVLQDAIAATDRIQHPPQPPEPPQLPAPVPPAVQILSSLPAGATVAGGVVWTIEPTNVSVDHVAFAVDGRQVGVQYAEPYEEALDTTTLADGPHALAVDVAVQGGGDYIAVWSVTVGNAPGAAVSVPPVEPVAVPIVKAPPPVPTPAAPPAAIPTVAPRALYRASAPMEPVTIKQLDAALVGYLDLGGAADAIQTTLRRAGLRPPPDTGTEAVARLLGLRLDHPAAEDGLELLPNQAATRAEAAWSFAHVLELSDWQTGFAASAAAAFTLPTLEAWQRRILATAIAYVGFPYVWGGTNPGPETEFGVSSPGGFDCSGFVWRVYKLTSYAGEGDLASVLRGRTTYQMSGEVPRSERITAARLQPGDVMFFGRGPRSQPSEVDHAAIYLGNGWLVQSSGQGVTLVPFDGWYRDSFAWGRRPLREAGLI